MPEMAPVLMKVITMNGKFVAQRIALIWKLLIDHMENLSRGERTLENQ
jgi:hypothetical protein